MKIVNTLEKIIDEEVDFYGNKAKNIWIMKKNEINVPDTIAVSRPETWKPFKNKEHAIQEIEMYVKQYFEHTEKLIVRSSFAKEDSEKFSMAGLFKSVQIDSYKQLSAALCEVWESANDAWSQMGIIIQPFIQCDFSGIMFSASPYDSKEETIIECAKTSCSHLVRGDITPDLYINKRGWVRGAGDYVSETILQELLNVNEKIRFIIGKEVDIEFCVKDRKLYILQCRPITTGKKKKPLYTGECEKGVWILQEELSLPFTPLIRTLDPSGLFAERPHMFFENYVYFSNEYRLKKTDDENWKNWEKISNHYSKVFYDILQKTDEADIELLEYAVDMYRSSVNAYMNLNWFIYRKKCYDELINVLKERYTNYQEKFFEVVQSIDTINSQKRKDFISLMQKKGDADFKQKKNEFVKKYGSETSHPFYIMCKSLADYIDVIMEKFENRKSDMSTCSVPYNNAIYDSTLAEVIDNYRNVIKRTEDDDYLLCLGSYTIRKLLECLEKKLRLEQDSIWFYEYNEIKDIISGNNISSEVIEKRRREFERAKNLDMPLVIKNGVGIYATTHEESMLNGVTISQGYAKGKIYVLKDPSDILEIITIPSGSIVFSNWISPILSAYFFNINGIIIPESSLLSHGAILAREMRIPAIGGIQFRFEDGMEVELNATEGKVKIGVVK